MAKNSWEKITYPYNKKYSRLRCMLLCQYAYLSRLVDSQIKCSIPWLSCQDEITSCTHSIQHVLFAPSKLPCIPTKVSLGEGHLSIDHEESDRKANQSLVRDFLIDGRCISTFFWKFLKVTKVVYSYLLKLLFLTLQLYFF